MEYALRESEAIEKATKCLNPCFNGICSASIIIILWNSDVLILVLMEYALRECILMDLHSLKVS
jgi:hypothetical protein